MNNLMARLHCMSHCLLTTSVTSLIWSVGTVIGQCLAGASICLPAAALGPVAAAGLLIGFLSMPVYNIYIK
jgi:hypothetical protein